jgi:hypothetical protein
MPDNAFIESLKGSFGAECLNANWFPSLDETLLMMLSSPQRLRNTTVTQEG